MRELINAAKAVIEYWDADVTDNLQDEVVGRLRAAVERAEKQKSKPWTKPLPTDFKEWWETYALNKYGMGPAYHAWSAGQQAERERIKAIIQQMSSNDPWIHVTSVMERIDDL